MEKKTEKKAKRKNKKQGRPPADSNCPALRMSVNPGLPTAAPNQQSAFCAAHCTKKTFETLFKTRSFHQNCIERMFFFPIQSFPPDGKTAKTKFANNNNNNKKHYSLS